MNQITNETSLTSAFKAIIEAMSKTMEMRDPYTSGHQKRVAQISVEIAKKVKWPQERINSLYMAAMVHDIGKIGVPAEILTKPTTLNFHELALVKEHVEIGYDILKDIPFPWPIAEMVRQHHERLDGTGYPRQLKSNEILDEAKILAIADTIESIATHRPYRPSRGLDFAITEIKNEAGVKLDKTFVEAAVSLMDKNQTLQNIINS